MPFYPLFQGVMVECIHRLFELPCECTFTFIPSPGHPGPSMEGAQTAVLQYWLIDILPLLSHELLFTEVKTTDVSVVGGVSIGAVFPVPFSGGIISGSCPANVSVRVNCRVENPPGGARGRFFLPGIPTNQVANNTLAPGWRSSLNDVAFNLIDRAALQGWRWVVPARSKVGRVPPPERVGLRIDGAKAESLWVSQRRRRLHNIVIV